MNEQATSIPNDVPKTPGYAWVILFAIYMATLSLTLNLFKVPPVIPTLIETFHLSYAKTMLIGSIFSIMGIILAIPAGYILKSYGVKKTCLFSVGAATIGSVLGAIVVSSTTLLFVARFIEGAGMGLIMVAAPFTISLWFPAQKRALATGLWASSVGIGNIIILFFGPEIMLMVNNEWQAVWWATAGFSALSFILFAILFRMPREDEITEIPPAPGPETQEETAPSLVKGMANMNLWMISISFGCYNLVILAILYVLPTFLQEQLEFVMSFKEGFLLNASFVTAFVMLASVFTAPLGGYISDRLGKRKIMILIPYILMTVMFLFIFKMSQSMIPLYIFVFGIVSGPIATVCLAAVPEVARKPQYIGIGMSVAALGQNIGMLVGPLLFGWILDRLATPDGVEIAAYVTGGYWMIPICVVGIIATLFIKVR
jgi:MFS family permease